MAPDSMGTDQDVYGEVDSGIVVFGFLCSRLLDGGIGALFRKNDQEGSDSIQKKNAEDSIVRSDSCLDCIDCQIRRKVGIIMKYRVELRGEHGEKIIIGSSKKESESFHDVIAKANRMKEKMEASDRVDKPIIYVPRGWLAKPDGS